MWVKVIANKASTRSESKLLTKGVYTKSELIPNSEFLFTKLAQVNELANRRTKRQTTTHCNTSAELTHERMQKNLVLINSTVDLSAELYKY